MAVRRGWLVAVCGAVRSWALYAMSTCDIGDTKTLVDPMATFDDPVKVVVFEHCIDGAFATLPLPHTDETDFVVWHSYRVPIDFDLTLARGPERTYRMAVNSFTDVSTHDPNDLYVS